MTHNVTIMFLAALLMLLGGEADAFLPVASAPPGCSSRQAAATSMSVSSTGGGGGPEGAEERGTGLTRAQAVRRVVSSAGSGVLAAGVLLGGASSAPQRAGAEEEMKDEVQQFAELRGQVEKKGRDDAVRAHTVC